MAIANTYSGISLIRFRSKLSTWSALTERKKDFSNTVILFPLKSSSLRFFWVSNRSFGKKVRPASLIVNILSLVVLNNKSLGKGFNVVDLMVRCVSSGMFARARDSNLMASFPFVKSICKFSILRVRSCPIIRQKIENNIER